MSHTPGIWIHWPHDNVFKALADGLTGCIFWDSPTKRTAGFGPNNPPMPRQPERLYFYNLLRWTQEMYPDTAQAVYRGGWMPAPHERWLDPSRGRDRDLVLSQAKLFLDHGVATQFFDGHGGMTPGLREAVLEWHRILGDEGVTVGTEPTILDSAPEWEHHPDYLHIPQLILTSGWEVREGNYRKISGHDYNICDFERLYLLVREPMDVKQLKEYWKRGAMLVATETPNDTRALVLEATGQ